MVKGNHKIIQSGSSSLQYSMHDFINAVKQHGGIWNREHEEFHVRELRERAWFDIARQLYDNFDAATAEEKQKIAETFAKRWKNTRDSFFRTLRRDNVDGEKSHRYIYEKEMNFILNVKSGTPRNSINYSIKKKAKKPKTKRTKDKHNPAQDDVDYADDAEKEEEGNFDGDTTTTPPSKSIKTEKNQSKKRLQASLKKTATEKKILAAKKMRYNADFDNELASLLDEEDAAPNVSNPKHQQQQQQQQQKHDLNDSNEFIEIYSEATTELTEANENRCIKKSSVTQEVQQQQPQNYETAFITFAKDFTENPQITSKPAATATTTAATTSELGNNTTLRSSAAVVGASSVSASAAAMPSSFFHSHSGDMDADQAFLYSIMPAIRSMSIAKKLDFQIDVLKLLKNYTSKS